MGLAPTLVGICKGGTWESQTHLTVLGAFKKISDDDQKFDSEKYKNKYA